MSITLSHAVPRPIGWTVRFAAWAAAATIPCAILIFGVDVPLYDEWNLVWLFEKVAQGTIGFVDLFRQWNEYRQFFPNLIFVTLGWAVKWDPRYLMLASWLLAVITAFALARLARLTLRGRELERLLLLLLTNLLIFSPAAYDNWLQGQQLIYFVPAACLAAALLLSQTPTQRPAVRLALCAALCFVATFSSANGLLCWLLILPLLTMAPAWRNVRRKPLYLAAWLGGLAGSAALYFYGYQSQSGRPGLDYLLSHSGEALTYFLGLLGSPLGLRDVETSVGAGTLLLAVYGFGGWRYWRADADRRADMLPWLVLGAYAILTAALITWGRLSVGTALGTRYISFTLYLAVSSAYLLVVGAGERLRQAQLAFVGALILWHVPVYLAAELHMRAFRDFQLRNKACVLISKVVPDPCALEVYGPQIAAGDLRTRAVAFDRLGLLRPPPMSRDTIGEIAADRSNGSDAGSLAEIIPLGGGRFAASGTAFLPERGTPANAVLLTWRTSGQEPRIFAFSPVIPALDPLLRLLGRTGREAGQWRETFDTHSLPAGPVEITAWSIDGRTGRAYKLTGTKAMGAARGDGRG